LGAAYLAGLAIGLWTKQEIAEQWLKEASFQPHLSIDTTARLQKGWKKAVERSLGWEEMK
jgi:glycerol kinase